MSNPGSLVRLGLIALFTAAGIGCGPGEADVGRNGKDAGSDAGAEADGGSLKTCDPSWPEICDGVDNNCDTKVDEGFDKDGDGHSTCGLRPDCNDAEPTVYPGAPELKNGVDDNCDNKIDFGADGVDYDQDGTPFPTDCNDDEPLIGPAAVEIADGLDNNCNKVVDEVIDCEAAITGTAAADFARALGLCGPFVQSVSFNAAANAGAAAIRSSFGAKFTPMGGQKMIQLSTGKAVDNVEEATYVPQPGTLFGDSTTHPLWAKPLCGSTATTAPAARDLLELKLTLKVPQNAQSLSYQVNFFSAEYPEYVCTQFNDRFIALLKSEAIDTTKLPGGKAPNCTSSTVPECNVSFDVKGQPVTVNNGFFSICKSAGSNVCAENSLPLLEKTGYDKPDGTRPVGGATGWLTTKAPVKPGETITLRFIVLDEGDTKYDSSVLLDNFKWDVTPVETPTTDPIG